MKCRCTKNEWGKMIHKECIRQDIWGMYKNIVAEVEIGKRLMKILWRKEKNDGHIREIEDRKIYTRIVLKVIAPILLCWSAETGRMTIVIEYFRHISDNCNNIIQKIFCYRAGFWQNDIWHENAYEADLFLHPLLFINTWLGRPNIEYEYCYVVTVIYVTSHVPSIPSQLIHKMKSV